MLHMKECASCRTLLEEDEFPFVRGSRPPCRSRVCELCAVLAKEREIRRRRQRRRENRQREAATARSVLGEREHT